MMQFWIGNSKQYLAVEYAKSARSTCRQCKQKIPKQQIRIGLLIDDDHFPASYWYHTKCFHFKPRHKVLDIDTLDQMIYGIQDLDPKDVDPILDSLKEELRNFQENKSGKKKKNTKKQKQEKKKEKQSSPEKSQQQNPKEKTKTKKSIKSKKQQIKKFLTPAQIKQYSQLVDEYQKMSSNQLKQILQKNNQAKSGTKSQLAQKCADGKQFGKIPICSKCGGGKLRFDREKGTYKCPGYMEDTDFVHCSGNFTFQQVKRQEWNE